MPQYQTDLSPEEEAQFQSWVKRENVPFDPSPVADYDMRGFYKAMMSGDERAQSGVSEVDNKVHYTDPWKTPFHPRFSNESIYAGKDAPHWEGEVLTKPSGDVITDEYQYQQLINAMKRAK